MKIYELKYSNTNTYLIVGDTGILLFDTGWAGNFPAFCGCMGELGIPVQDISYIVISHFHPDHMGIAQEIADLGARIVVTDVQQAYIHAADSVFEKEDGHGFKPVRDEDVILLGVSESRAFLEKLGLNGEIIHTPGHSDDSISLWLDSGELFVGDLNPLYELELHKGTQIEESWNRLLALGPATVYYGHAKKADLNTDTVSTDDAGTEAVSEADTGAEAGARNVAGDRYDLVSKIMRLIDKGVSQDRIQKKTGADRNFIEDVTRMYLTHQNVGVQGILDRIEIKGR